MEEFTLKGENGFIRLSLGTIHGFPERTCWQGGYEADGVLEIQVETYHVKSRLDFSTGQIYDFFIALSNAHSALNGIAQFKSFEYELELSVEYRQRGQVRIAGFYKMLHHLETKLVFEILSDQSFISSGIKELENIVKM